VPLLRRLLANLLDSLRDDSFTRVYALTPQGLNLGLGAARISLPHSNSLGPLADGLLLADEERGKVLLIPIGHTEQHGPHLPLCTDTLIIEAIGRGTADSLPELAACLPVFPYGASTHRASFAGTLNCGGPRF